ncbi:MAG: hypothetical protein QOI01_5590 [Mycobacterium sp.]|jgi:hypothetical protein|nr:hypothetical protein [Mycobacterium sp.]
MPVQSANQPGVITELRNSAAHGPTADHSTKLIRKQQRSPIRRELHGPLANWWVATGECPVQYGDEGVPFAQMGFQFGISPTISLPARIEFAAARRWSDGPSSQRVDREGYGDDVVADGDGSFATGGGRCADETFLE